MLLRRARKFTPLLEEVQQHNEQLQMNETIVQVCAGYSCRLSPVRVCPCQEARWGEGDKEKDSKWSRSRRALATVRDMAAREWCSFRQGQAWVGRRIGALRWVSWRTVSRYCVGVCASVCECASLHAVCVCTRASVHTSECVCACASDGVRMCMHLCV